jgi:hypothetical protein
VNDSQILLCLSHFGIEVIQLNARLAVKVISESIADAPPHDPSEAECGSCKSRAADLHEVTAICQQDHTTQKECHCDDCHGVDDEYSRTFRVEQLSGGTREQVFLALRFALVREFASRGIELPVIMDDLFVNFDEERTKAAADCLIEIAAEGQQILFFTCHQHLAELFQQKDVAPLWLPGHKVAYDLHKPEDEAAAFSGVDETVIEEAVAGTAESGALKGVFHPNADELFEDDAEAEAEELRRQG